MQQIARIGPALILLVIAILVNWKLTLTDQYTWLDSPDLAHQVLPWFQEEAAQTRHSRLPVWDMHHWGGQSLLGQDQPGVLFPLNWILFLMKQWHGRIALQFLNWYYVLMHYFAALFCFLLARDLGLSRFAAICAGASFGLSGLLGNLTWPQMLNSGMWAPLVLLFVARALDGRRPLVSISIAGFITGFSFYGGHHQLPSFTILAVALLLLFFALTGRTPFRRVALLTPIYLLFTLLAGAPQLLPSYEYWARGLRWVGAPNPVGFHDKVPYIVFDQFSVNPVSLFGLFYPGSFPSAMHFVGLTILSLGVFAAAMAWRSRWAPPFVALAIGGVLFSLGKYSFFHGILYSALPFLDKSRNAAFGMFIVDLALAMLAGIGIDIVLRDRPAQLRRLGNSLLWLGALLSGVLLARAAWQGDKVMEDVAFAYIILSAILLGCAMRAWQLERIPRRAAMLAIIGLMLFEIGSITNRDLPHIESGWSYLYELSRHDDLAVVLHAQPGLFRVERNEEDIHYNFGDWYALDEFRGYAGVTRNVFIMVGEPNARELMGVKYHVGHQPFSSDSEPLYRGQSGVNIYPIPQAFPRAWAVHSAESVANEEQARAHMRVPLEQLASRTFVVGRAPSLDACTGQESIQATETRNMQFNIDADMACKGMVVISNTFFTGWRAEVDGKSVQVYEAYNFLQGVVVDRGRHRILLHYVPTTLYIGLALAVLAIGGVVALLRLQPAS